MAVSADDDCKSHRFGFQIKLVQMVQDVDGYALNVKHIGCRNLLCPGFAIYVAANCGERRDPTEFLQDVRITDVPGAGFSDSTQNARNRSESS